MTSEAGAGGGEDPRAYAVRVADHAAEQILAEQDRLQTTAGEAAADAWSEGMADAIASLATYPERCAVAVENAIFLERGGQGLLRQFLYQRRRGGPAWRILFTVREADEDDPPTVRVRSIRHSAQAPMTEWPLDTEA